MTGARSRGPAAPIELTAPLEWHPDELDRLRQRVQELMLTGLRRSEASQAAFAELVTNRALARARDAAQAPPEFPEPAA